MTAPTPTPVLQLLEVGIDSDGLFLHADYSCRNPAFAFHGGLLWKLERCGFVAFDGLTFALVYRPAWGRGFDPNDPPGDVAAVWDTA